MAIPSIAFNPNDLGCLPIVHELGLEKRSSSAGRTDWPSSVRFLSSYGTAFTA